MQKMVICDVTISGHFVNRKSCIETPANKNGKVSEKYFGWYVGYKKTQVKVNYKWLKKSDCKN